MPISTFITATSFIAGWYFTIIYSRHYFRNTIVSNYTDISTGINGTLRQLLVPPTSPVPCRHLVLETSRRLPPIPRTNFAAGHVRKLQNDFTLSSAKCVNYSASRGLTEAQYFEAHRYAVKHHYSFSFRRWQMIIMTFFTADQLFADECRFARASPSRLQFLATSRTPKPTPLPRHHLRSQFVTTL
jgi:hypothetical protein